MFFALLLACLTPLDHGPAELDLVALERRLRDRLSHVPFESAAFRRTYRKCLWPLGATLSWQPVYGPTPVLVGTVFSSWHFRMASIAFWKTRTGTGAQILDQLGIGTADPGVYRIDGETYRKGDRMVRCGSGSDNGNWEWPAAQIFRLRGDRWVRTASYTNHETCIMPGPWFLRRHGRIVPDRFFTTLAVYPDHLDQNPTNPTLVYRQIWRIVGDRIAPEKAVLVPTPVAELDRVAALAQSNDRRAFDAAVPASERPRLWELLKKHVRAEKINEYWTEFDRHLFLTDEETRKSVYVELVKRQGRYRLVDTQTTP